MKLGPVASFQSHLIAVPAVQQLRIFAIPPGSHDTFTLSHSDMIAHRDFLKNILEEYTAVSLAELLSSNVPALSPEKALAEWELTFSRTQTAVNEINDKAVSILQVSLPPLLIRCA